MHVPAALWECWDPCYWWTYQRHCGMLGPEILVDVPAASCERWAQMGSTQERAPPARQPTRELVGRVTVFVSGNPVVFFNTAGTPEQVSKELYMVSAWLGLRPSWFGFGFVLFSFIPSPFPLSSLFFPLLALRRRSVPAFPLTSAYLGRLFMVANDYLDHGPPRGCAAALKVTSSSLLCTSPSPLCLGT